MIRNKINLISTSIVLYSFIFIILSSCVSFKMDSTKSSKKLFETFYIGDKGTQYFIKPLLFETNDSKNHLQIDFTFKYKNELINNATINYSVIKNKIVNNIDSIIISNTVNSITIRENKILFKEKYKKLFKTRFTTKMPLNKLKTIYSKNDWQIQLYTENMKEVFLPSNKTKKNIQKLKDNLFIILE